MERQGVRVVSINDEGCATNNFWLQMTKEGGCCKAESADPGIEHDPLQSYRRRDHASR